MLKNKLMTRDELEKMFDEEFYFKWMNSLQLLELSTHKQFIFETIIPEVLNSVIPPDNIYRTMVFDLFFLVFFVLIIQYLLVLA